MRTRRQQVSANAFGSAFGSAVKPLFAIGLCLLLTACKVELYSNLSETEVNDMLSIVLENGIDAERIAAPDGSYTLSVEESQRAQAIRLLRNHGFPRQKYDGLETYNESGGLISSPLQERARFIHALSQEVAKTLSQIDGVVTARVHLVLSEKNAFDEQVSPPSASVFIKHRSDINLTVNKTEIKMIVEKSIEGLSYDRISVVLLPTQTTPLRVDGFAPVAAQNSGGFPWLLISGLTLLLLTALAGMGYTFLLWQRQKQQAGVIISRANNSMTATVASVEPAKQPIRKESQGG